MDLEFRRDIIWEMVPEINVKNLKNKMVEIFHFKIGVDQKKQSIYYSNKVSTILTIALFIRNASITDLIHY